MTTALVTGAAGFIAPYVASALRRLGVSQVVGHDLLSRHESAFDGFRAGSLASAADASAVVAWANPGIVVHLAGRFRGSPAELEMANADVTRHLLDAVVAHGPAVVVCAGSAAEYGPPQRPSGVLSEADDVRPVTPYGRAKAAATAIALQRVPAGGRVTVARLFNVIGPGMSPALFLGAIVARLREALAAESPPVVAVGNLHVARDFVAVEDAAHMLARLAVDPTAPAGVCNVASGIATPLTALTDALAAAAGVEVTFARDAALVRDDDPPVVVGDISRLRSWVGDVPAPAIRDVVAATWRAA